MFVVLNRPIAGAESISGAIKAAMDGESADVVEIKRKA